MHVQQHIDAIALPEPAEEEPEMPSFSELEFTSSFNDALHNLNNDSIIGDLNAFSPTTLDVAEICDTHSSKNQSALQEQQPKPIEHIKVEKKYNPSTSDHFEAQERAYPPPPLVRSSTVDVNSLKNFPGKHNFTLFVSDENVNRNKVCSLLFVLHAIIYMYKKIIIEKRSCFIFYYDSQESLEEI